jgi:hypothetical protein
VGEVDEKHARKLAAKKAKAPKDLKEESDTINTMRRTTTTTLVVEHLLCYFTFFIVC